MKEKNPIDIAKLKAKDLIELKKFSAMASSWIFNSILHSVKNYQDAEEITQDCVLSALRSLDTFRSDASLKTWIFRISINKIKDYYRYSSRRKRSATIVPLVNENNDQEKYEREIPDHWHPGVQLESKEEIELLFWGIDQLNENQKQALILAKLDKLKYAEIADIMSTTAKAVESLVSRAKSNLILILENIKKDNEG